MNSGGDRAGRHLEAHSHAGCSQSGSELSSRLDALSADRDELSRVVRQREADLLAAQSLAREKEEALSQEQQRSSRERDELQGRLADKVGEGSGARPPRVMAMWGQEPFLALSWLPCSGRSHPGTEGWSRACLQSPLPSEGLRGHLAS